MLELDLKQLISELKGYMGITRKAQIHDVVRSFPHFVDLFSKIEIVADFGEDAAVLTNLTNLANHTGSGNDQQVLLLAADGIMPVMINADAFWSGYCSVLVNLHDIAAMGGMPLAMVDVITVQNKTVLTELTRGMNDACTKFGVPVVGGHIHPDAEYNALDVAILGTAKRSAVIYSSTAKVGDVIIFAMDLDGRVHPNARFAWDTTLHKSSNIVRKQLSIMPELGLGQLVNSGKDISNPGALGTLGMLLESSKCGANVDLTNIPRPPEEKIDFSQWLKVYQGCGFVVTCEPGNSQKVIEKFNSAGITAKAAGTIIKNNKLIIEHKKNSEILFDFKSDKITGI